MVAKVEANKALELAYREAQDVYNAGQKTLATMGLDLEDGIKSRLAQIPPVEALTATANLTPTLALTSTLTRTLLYPKGEDQRTRRRRAAA